MECPKCGFWFRLRLFDSKQSGATVEEGVAYMFECPKCHFKFWVKSKTVEDEAKLKEG